MSYRALYREWRPKIFDDVVGQKHITVTLKNQILKDRIAHAYLLCGTRGTGKTSTAKIMAKALNCTNLKDGEPCNECEACKKINSGLSMDVTELDAASNNGVDNIRDIIDDVQYPPQELKYKVYIMDEVHMLSSGAVNAFLKTLEEPPKNVVFILATTDPQKLPITILSRCQRFDFKRIKGEDIFKLLRKIVEAQGVYAEDKSLQLIARISDGAMRDSLSILDQAISMGGGKVEYSSLIGMLGLVTNENLLKLVDAFIDKDIERAIRIIDEIVLAGKEINTFIRDIITHMRNLMIVKVSSNAEDILDMSLENIELLKTQAQKIRIEEIMRDINVLQEAEEQAKWSKQARIYLELAAIKLCKIEFDTSREVLLARINRLEEAIKSGNIAINVSGGNSKASKNIPENSAPKVQRQTAVKPAIDEPGNTDSKLTIEDVKKAWKDILDSFKGRRQMIIYASLMTGKPYSCKDGIVEILYDEQYAFNKNRLEKEDNRKVVENVFGEILNEKVRVRYVVQGGGGAQEKSPEELVLEAFGEDIVQIIED